jgi:hypothetical protein
MTWCIGLNLKSMTAVRARTEALMSDWKVSRMATPTPTASHASTTGNAAHETCLAPRVNIEARHHAAAASCPRDTMRPSPALVHFRGVP